MGEIADAMLSGEMCEGCGEFIGCIECDNGFPTYCSPMCAEDRGADESQVCDHDTE